MDKLLGRCDFELDVAAGAFAGINREHNAQWQLRFALKYADSLGYAIFQNLEIIFGEIGDGRSMLVSDCGKYIYQADVHAERRFVRARALLRGAGGNLITTDMILCGDAARQHREKK